MSADRRLLTLLIVFSLSLSTITSRFSCVYAQSDAVPKVTYGLSRAPRYPIGGFVVEGLEGSGLEDYLVVGISGLSIGDEVSVPGEEITAAVKRFWKHGLFSNVSIEVDHIQNDSIYLKYVLSTRPKVSQVNIEGVKKGEKTDLEQKIGITKGNQITPDMVSKAEYVIKKYFDDKGFKNAEVEITQKDDINHDGQVIVDVNIDKNEKVKVHEIYITGNDNLSYKKITGTPFTSSLLKKTHVKGIRGLFKTKKFVPEKFKEDKQRVLDKYGELGFRDIELVDSIVDLGDNTIDIYMHFNEGQRYYVRDINWVGNTIYTTDALNRVLRMEKGDVYDSQHIHDRLQSSGDDDAVANYYFNDGYVFSSVTPVETTVDGDSIDLEIRIYEGIQATINSIKIYGNTMVYEEVVRRELKLKPGDLFSMDAFKMSVQEIAQMGHFDPEGIKPEPLPNRADGTVDINLGLTPKANDQVEFSLGWGQIGVTFKLGLKFGNFSMRNLFKKDKNSRGFLPRGDGQQLELSASTNGSYYQQYSISFYDPWFGRKRPNSFSVSAFFSRQTDISSSYYNSSYYNSYYSALYGYGNYNSSYYNNYSSYYDPDKYIQLFGVSIGWGKRLNWPDNNFSLSANLSYTRYMLQDWEYFLITNGNCNNINLTLRLARTSIDNSVFPRRGSELAFSVSATPPYSSFDGVNYSSLATDPADANYQSDLQKKYRWIEYHKWKFQSKFYTPLNSKAQSTKCFVLMTRLDFGLLGYYNKHKQSPFETFYVGGDGMTGYSSSYYTETIGLRGYDNGSLTPSGYSGYAYSRLTAEIRYPLMLQGSTNIWALGFVEGGNAWTSVSKFNPFDMKRSAGFGVRIMLPMVGLMGIDWGYGFDKIYGSSSYGGSQFHFVLGQEF